MNEITHLRTTQNWPPRRMQQGRKAYACESVLISKSRLCRANQYERGLFYRDARLRGFVT